MRMPTSQISIRIDSELLGRVDALADADGLSHTAVIERAIRKDVPQQEAYNRSLENPAVRMIHEQLTRPSVLRVIAKVANEDLTDEQLDWAMNQAPKHRQAAKRRAAGSTSPTPSTTGSTDDDPYPRGLPDEG